MCCWMFELQVAGLSYWVWCRVWCYDSDLNLPPCQCQDCQDWARHDTKYKQKYHSKCKSFLYEREIAALNLAWVVVSGWGMEPRPQIILQRKQTTQTLLNENVIKSYLKTYIDKILWNGLYGWKLNNFSPHLLLHSSAWARVQGVTLCLQMSLDLQCSNIRHQGSNLIYNTQYCSSNAMSISSHQQCISHVIYLDLRSFKTHFFSQQRSGCAINLTLIWGLLWSIRLNIRE